MSKNHYYVTCPDCGANLDPGETCDCKVNNDVFYLCDRRKCHKCSYPECKHTQDITHAKNFTVTGIDSVYFEEDDYECQE